MQLLRDFLAVQDQRIVNAAQERLAIEAIAQVRSTPWWRRLPLRLLRRNDTPPADPVSNLYWTVARTVSAGNGRSVRFVAVRQPIRSGTHAGNGHRSGSPGPPSSPCCWARAREAARLALRPGDDGPSRRHPPEAHLEGAFFIGAHLERTALYETHLEGAFSYV